MSINQQLQQPAQLNLNNFLHNLANQIAALQNSISTAYTTPTVFHFHYSFPGTPNLNFASSNEIAKALKINNWLPVINNNPGVNNNNNPTLNKNDQQETFQVLLTLMNNNSDLFNNAGNQALYLGIPDDESLFFLADRPIYPKPIANTLIRKKRPTGLKITDLIDLKETEGDKDSDIKIDQELPDPVVQDQEKIDLAELCDTSKVELPKVNKKDDMKVV
ncbi:27007_t:CDS:2 [Racocetra persica]|uniref:27007_t:CDS:1 n=1 Tax=Racocetra persica TaxID=160502 RepID=A0ACA9LU31_9GLOM|nr:27007_t:CDS:2 [Racocetra persica]